MSGRQRDGGGREKREGGRARDSPPRDRSPLHTKHHHREKRDRRTSNDESWDQERRHYDYEIKQEVIDIKQEPDDDISPTRGHQPVSNNRHDDRRHKNTSRDISKNINRNTSGNTETDRWRDEDRNVETNRHRDRDTNVDRDRSRGRGRDVDRQGARQGDSNMRDQRRERYENDRRRLEVRAERIKQEPDGQQSWGRSDGSSSNTEAAAANKKEKEKPTLELSGKLADDTNVFRGVVIKYHEPEEARKPRKRWRFHPFKGDEALPILHLHRQSAFLLGRDRKIADIPVDHPSCSKQHAVLQFRLVPYKRADGTMGRRVSPYIIDLGSANGTYVNNQRIEAQRFVELLEKDVVKFGFSSRDYVLLHDSSDTSEITAGDDEGED